jgi:hypothetical protein
MALIPVLTFYVNDAEPEGQRLAAFTIQSPIRPDKRVTAVITDPEAASGFMGGLSDSLLGVARTLEAAGLLTDKPVAGYEELFPTVAVEEAA